MKLFLNILFFTYTSALDNEWWKYSTVYEIFTPSFKDSDGNGYGDLKGVTSKLDYLNDLGIDTVWLSPYHASPMLDTGYDISNYMAINPLFGTMADFDELMRQLKKRGMKFIMEFVINHSSDKHMWFKKSVERIHPYTNYYVWRDAKGYDANGQPIVPNNWLSIYDTSAWTWNEKRKQFYYHIFLPQQPDFNLRNARMRNEIKKIIRFWINKGVAGFRLDSVNWLMEDTSFDNELILTNDEKFHYYNLRHDKTFNIKDTFDYVYDLRAYVDKLSMQINTYQRIIISEAWGSVNELKALQGNGKRLGTHFSFNFMFIFRWDYMSSRELNEKIDDWQSITGNTSIDNWALDSHDLIRSSFTFVQEYVNIMLTVISLLPGVTILYYGEEIGMTIGVLRSHHRRSIGVYSQTPMQWDESRNAGFSKNESTWLPVNPNYWKLNVKNQDVRPNSTYNFLKSVLKLKKTDAIKYGDLKKYILSNSVFVFTRSYKNERYITILNLGTKWTTVRLKPDLPDVSGILEVSAASTNSRLKKGFKINARKKHSIGMKSMSVVVLFQKNNKSV